MPLGAIATQRGSAPAADIQDWLEAARRANELRRPDLAARALAAAVELAPADPEIWFGLGHALADAGQPLDAEQAYRRVADLLPDRVDVRINVGAMLERRHRYAEASIEYAAAARGEHNALAALNNLAGAMNIQGRAAEALAVYRRALRGAAPGAQAWSNFLYAQHYVSTNTAVQIAADHLAWGAKYGAGVDRLMRGGARDRAKTRLRIGYISPNFVRHSVAYFALPLFAGHDRNRVEVWCYSTAPRRDLMTGQLKAVADAWVDASTMDDVQLADQIRGDEIDVLIDLAGHTGGGRLGVLARKPAPLQASYLGYPNTTGLEEVDLRFTDGLADPGVDDAHMVSERLVRLPRPFLAYAPSDSAPDVAPRSAGADRPVTFGSFNNLAKVSPETLDLWAEVLRQTPDSRLLLKARGFSDAETRDRFADLFDARGVKRSRLDLRPHTADVADHLAAYNEVDIALDAWPYNGVTTTMEALWMGVPVVTISADRHAGRVGRSLLSAVGLGRMVRHDRRSFVQAAVGLAGDADGRQALRRRLRDKVAASPLVDGQGLAAAIEEAIFAAWAGALD